MKRILNNTAHSYLFIIVGISLFSTAWFVISVEELLSTWPVQLALLGILIGFITRFTHPISYVLTCLGLLFAFFIKLPVEHTWFIFPLIFILIGILKLFVTKPTLHYSNVRVSYTQNKMNK